MLMVFLVLRKYSMTLRWRRLLLSFKPWREGKAFALLVVTLLISTDEYRTNEFSLDEEHFTNPFQSSLYKSKANLILRFEMLLPIL